MCLHLAVSFRGWKSLQRGHNCIIKGDVMDLNDEFHWARSTYNEKLVRLHLRENIATEGRLNDSHEGGETPFIIEWAHNSPSRWKNVLINEKNNELSKYGGVLAFSRRGCVLNVIVVVVWIVQWCQSGGTESCEQKIESKRVRQVGYLNFTFLGFKVYGKTVLTNMG